MGPDMSSDSLVIERIPFRHSRVGNLPYVIYFSACLVTLAALLLIAGAVLTALVYTEVRPPTADENYQRYIGADFRRVIGTPSTLRRIHNYPTFANDAKTIMRLNIREEIMKS